ncbi:MAG: DUF2834 domain-containing protein [Myxococcales bacterium]
MLSLILHAVAGVLVTALALYMNRHLLRRGWKGATPSVLEAGYYLIAVASVAIGWYFNVVYVFSYPNEASWAHYIKLLFTNPAACSGSQDYCFANVLLFPMWIISDGPRRGIRWAFLFFLMSLVTSFGFSMALYLAVQERQVRWRAAQGGAHA